MPDTLAVFEQRLSRLLTAFLCSGLLFLLGPGSFLGLWNLLAISRQRAAFGASPAWLQAHGHAEIYGWVGSFILGIGFHSLVRLRGVRLSLPWAWSCWVMWTLGVGLRWWGGISAWHWRIVVPTAAGLELVAFAIFQRSIARAHRPIEPPAESLVPSQPAWVLLILTGACGFLLTLALNFGFDVYVAGWGGSPAYPPALDERLVALMAWAFLAPFVFGFSARWLPILAGLPPASDTVPRLLIVPIVAGTAATLVGATGFAAGCWLAAALAAIIGLHLWQPALQPAKTRGIHPSFRFFLRLAYGWLLVSALLGFWSTLAPNLSGIGGASRHAFTVGFIAGMILTIGPRILPAFSGMRVLFSARLMFAALALLSIGCTLRVAGEILAYSGWLPVAWRWLPISAGLEVAALTAFAYNLARTLTQPPAHQMQRRGTQATGDLRIVV